MGQNLNKLRAFYGGSKGDPPFFILYIYIVSLRGYKFKGNFTMNNTNNRTLDENRPLFPYEIEAMQREKIRHCMKNGQAFRITLDNVDKEAVAFAEFEEKTRRESRSVFNPRRRHFIN